MILPIFVCHRPLKHNLKIHNIPLHQYAITDILMQNDTYYLHLKLIDFNNHVLTFHICKMAICKRPASFSTMQCVLSFEQYKTGLKIKVIEQEFSSRKY